MNKRVAIYTRTIDGQDPDANAIRQYCDKQGWEVVRQYHDMTLLGAKDKKKQQDILLRDAKTHCFDVVVVSSLSAWGKSLKHIVDTVTGLKQHGVLFVSVQDTIDPETVDALKHFLKSVKSDAVKAGMMIARLRGLQIGRTPTPQHQVASIIACHEQDKLSVRDIGKKTGTPRSTVFNTLKQYRAGTIDRNGMPVQKAAD